MPGHDHHTQGSSISSLFAAGQCMRPGSLKQHMVASQTLCRSSAVVSAAFSGVPVHKPGETLVGVPTPALDMGLTSSEAGEESTWPPSLKLSGVRFRMAMTRVR